MFKGIVALFTSGIIFNPVVLLGVISGAYAVLHFDPETIRNLLLNPYFYLGIGCFSVFYTFVFSRTYKEGGLDIDFGATAIKSILNVVRYLISFVLAMSFITMISIF